MCISPNVCIDMLCRWGSIDMINQFLNKCLKWMRWKICAVNFHSRNKSRFRSSNNIEIGHDIRSIYKTFFIKKYLDDITSSNHGIFNAYIIFILDNVLRLCNLNLWRNVAMSINRRFHGSVLWWSILNNVPRLYNLNFGKNSHKYTFPWKHYMMK